MMVAGIRMSAKFKISEFENYVTRQVMRELKDDSFVFGVSNSRDLLKVWPPHVTA